jgi:hypothetical protein
MLMAREFLKSQIRLIGPHYTDRGGFDRKGEPGKLKESPRGTERRFGNSESACFLRTQQRAKSQCMIDVQTPVAGCFGVSHGFGHGSDSWLGFWFPAGPWGLAGAGHSTESLILAQDERWRRA